MKKSKSVIAAQEALKTKLEQLDAAKADVLRLQSELSLAYQAVTAAQTEDDAKMPQCRVIEVSGRGQKETAFATHVILRKTPSGMLVVRHVGAADGYKYKFKWNIHERVFISTEKPISNFFCRSELRDVPEQFIPTTGEQS